MTTYTITPSGSEAHFEPFAVEAQTYEDAAHVAARRLNTGICHARRVSGLHGKSGVFQAYRSLSRGMSESSTGPNFHVGKI